MKHLPLVLFIGHLVFLCTKSTLSSISIEEVLLSGLLFLMVTGREILRHLHRSNYNSHLINKSKLRLEELQIEYNKPVLEDPEVMALKKDNDIEALKLKKFITEQEYTKRESSRIIEKQGGLRF